jgi:phosphoribosylaminoimidazole-succinocarboxamide synthase
VPLAAPLIETRLNGLAPHRQGKVRDIFDLGEALVMVATDRISAFDYVLGSGIPDKGRILTQLSAFWFDRTQAIVPNHVLTLDVGAEPAAVRRDAALQFGR